MIAVFDDTGKGDLRVVIRSKGDKNPVKVLVLIVSGTPVGGAGFCTLRKFRRKVAKY